MRAEVLKDVTAKEFTTGERCHITEIANDSGDEDVSIARARVEPGVTTAWHKLTDVNERYIIVSGEGRVEINGLVPMDVGAGDVARIPAGTAQRISNTGQIDLIFYAVCSPPFKGECYESLE